MKNNNLFPLQCPNDGGALKIMDGGLICLKCSAIYPLAHGAYKFLLVNDDFYEGAYKNATKFIPKSENFFHTWPLLIINSGWIWHIRSNVPKGALVVELGCASGVKYLGQRYRMIGCDLSLQSLAPLDFYNYKLQIDGSVDLPIRSESVDAVVSSYFWEHIQPEKKTQILKECHRILKPGGRIIFLHDVETFNPLIKFFKQKDINRYHKEFIDGDGHFGYESYKDNFEKFELMGFKVLKSKCMEKFIFQSPSTYEKLSSFQGLLAKFFHKIKFIQNPPFFYIYSIFLRVADSFMCIFLPDSWGRIQIIVAKKGS